MLTYDTPAYMFNVYKNQLSRQTESRNLTDPKTLPTIWHTYMKLVTKYQISVINSCWEKCDEKYLGKTTVGRTDRRTDGRTDGQTDGRKDGRTDGRTEGRTDGRKDGRTDGRTDRGKTVYPLRWSGSIIRKKRYIHREHCNVLYIDAIFLWHCIKCKYS